MLIIWDDNVTYKTCLISVRLQKTKKRIKNNNFPRSPCFESLRKTVIYSFSHLRLRETKMIGRTFTKKKQTNEKTKTRERNEKLITHLLLPSQQSVVLQLHAVSLFIAHTRPR